MAYWRASSMAAVVLVAVVGCGKVQSDDIDADTTDAPVAPVDASVDATVDAATDPTPATGPGSAKEPADSCEALRVLVGVKSGVYWVKHPDGHSPAFKVYCEQEINNGGWAMLENSVGSTAGNTTAFWGYTYAQRFDTFGTPAADQNYYQGSLYLIATQYLDVTFDLSNKLGILATMTAKSIDTNTMRFVDPAWSNGGLQEVYVEQFASGWSSKDKDLDPHPQNCALTYAGVAQHYNNCWYYNLGADADGEPMDSGWGPHVEDGILSKLGLALQSPSGGHSRVNRIARFARW